MLQKINLKGLVAPLLKSVMSLEQLTFTGKGWYLVLKLFASIYINEVCFDFCDIYNVTIIN